LSSGILTVRCLAGMEAHFNCFFCVWCGQAAGNREGFGEGPK
jgi:hypothetical protein